MSTSPGEPTLSVELSRYTLLSIEGRRRERIARPEGYWNPVNLTELPLHQVRASFDAATVRVYQAYSDAIADSALAAGTFVSPPFKMDRMTWIKPSFLWMMYRSGWGRKPGQERILGIDVTRVGFEWALSHACLSCFSKDLYETSERWQNDLAQSSVRIQWDPERDIHLNRLPHRAIQIGLRGVAVRHYVHEWIEGIEDISSLARTIRELVERGDVAQARSLLPVETELPLGSEARRAAGISSSSTDRI